jgi:hypothetical protein
MYPRSLPLVNPENYRDDEEWNEPWPSDICPAIWQSGLPGLIAPYLGVPVKDPYKYLDLPNEFDEKRLPVFQCPGNDIPEEDLISRKCNYKLDYGLANWASQNRRADVLLSRHFVASDMTWGLGYVEDGSGGPHEEPELEFWWTSFVHNDETANVYRPDHSVSRTTKSEFIGMYTDDPPVDDKL